MTLETCYEVIGGDYKGVLSRMIDDKLVKKFVIRFLDDPSFSDLQDARKSNELEKAFRAAHTLKGVSQNLGFTRLHEACSDLTEALRDGNSNNLDSMFQRIEDIYMQTISAIHEMQEKQE